MNSTIEIDGKKMQSIKSVAKKVSYSRDYITRLAREEKITAMNVGRQWFVDPDSLNNYAESSALETSLRRKQLSEERKKEQQIRTATTKKKSSRDNRVRRLNVHATLVASFVLGVGLFGGWVTNYSISPEHNISDITESVFSILKPQSQFGLLGDKEKVESNLTVAFVDEPTPFVEQKSISRLESISKNIENGILLLPQGSLSASATEMFSDEVEVLTSSDGTQMVVRVDEEGRPVGNVIPFVMVPVNHSEI